MRKIRVEACLFTAAGTKISLGDRVVYMPDKWTNPEIELSAKSIGEELACEAVKITWVEESEDSE